MAKLKKVAHATKLTKEEWLELRQKGIGGSDVGALMGFNKWKSPLQLWMEKTGQVEQPDLSGNEAVYWGTQLESVVAMEFTKRTGLQVRRNNFILRHPKYEFMLANIDREGTDEAGKRFVLECKTTNSYGAKDWQDGDIPPAHELQVLHYILVGGYDYGYIACLIGNQKFVIKKLTLEPAVAEIIINAEKDFWDKVVNNEMPPVDGSEACCSMISDLYPVAKESSSIRLGDETEVLLNTREALKCQEKEISEKISLIDNQLKQSLQDCELGYTDSYRISWKNVKTNRFDSKSFKAQYPELSVKFTKSSVSRRFSISANK